MWAKSSFWFYYQLARLRTWFQNKTVLRLRQHLLLKRLLKHINRQIPFYRGAENMSFSKLPIVDKSFMIDNFKEMNAASLSFEEAKNIVGREKSNFYAQQSVSTSGVPGVYLYSNEEMQCALMSILSKFLPPFTIKFPKIAVFYLSQSPYFPKKNSSTCFDWHFFDLNQNFEEDLLSLQAFNPDVIIAPVQTLCKLARLHNEKSIVLHVQKIISTQEVITPIEEKLIASSFEQNVHQLYQCAEGWLGATCVYGTFHMDEDQFFIEKEWIDDTHTRFIPVITTLHRKVQPLVRYRMEDILILNRKPCACGNPMLAFDKIVGRCEDMFYFSDFNQRSVLKPIYADNIHLAINRAGGNIQKYQLFQHSPHHVVIKMQADNIELAKHSIEQQFEKLSSMHGVKCPCLEFLPLDPLPLNQMFRQTKRLLKIPS